MKSVQVHATPHEHSLIAANLCGTLQNCADRCNFVRVILENAHCMVDNVALYLE